MLVEWKTQFEWWASQIRGTSGTFGNWSNEVKERIQSLLRIIEVHAVHSRVLLDHERARIKMACLQWNGEGTRMRQVNQASHHPLLLKTKLAQPLCIFVERFGHRGPTVR